VTDRHVLLVEDNPNDEALTLRAFKKCNILNEVLIARDGAEALAHLLNEDGDATRPVLVLLDLKLPKIDGLEVLRRIRADPRTRHIPVIVLTTSAQEDDVIASYRLGANAYVRKPIKFSAFAEAVKTIGVFWLLLSEPMPEVISSAPPGLSPGHPTTTPGLTP
jgi:two-component system response regulator